MLKYSSLSTVGSFSEQFSIMFSFFCQLLHQETCFHQRQRALRQFSRFDCNLGQICPWMGIKQSSLPYLYHSLYSQDWHLSLRQLFFAQKNICEDLWKDFDSRQIKAGDFFKKISTLQVSSSPEFFTPNIHPSHSDGAHPAWPGLGHTWAPIPGHLSLVWNIWESGILPLISVVVCTRSQCSKGKESLDISPPTFSTQEAFEHLYSHVYLKKKLRNFWLSISFHFFTPVPLPQVATSLSLHDQSNCMHLY